MKTKFIVLFFICALGASSAFGNSGNAASCYFQDSPMGCNPNKILRLLKKRERRVSKESFVAKNIHYDELKDKLPKIEEQMLVCYEGSKIWLELTNFEFLINSKESNNLVKVYIGEVGNKDLAVRLPIEIYDPEAVFVFQDAITKFWDNLLDRSTQKISEALKVGYRAMSYHFGFAESLRTDLASDAVQMSICNENNSLQKNILDLQSFLNKKHQDEMKSLDRLATKELITKRKSQGLTAFYSNPIYLGDMTLYSRPNWMSYKDYVLASMKPTLLPKFNYLSKYDDINYKSRDKYSPILDRLYPEGKAYYEKENGEIYKGGLRRISTYVFRADTRSINEVYEAEGFWPRFCAVKVGIDLPPGVVAQDEKRQRKYCTSHKYFSESYENDINREQIIERYCPEYKFSSMDEAAEMLDENIFKKYCNAFQIFNKDTVDELLNEDMFLRVFYMNRVGLIPLDSGYISTSKYFVRRYGHSRISYTYAAFLEGGVVMPSVNDKGKLAKTFMNHEVAAPGGIDWENIVGARKRINLLEESKQVLEKFHFVGPVFLKDSLSEDDKDNFWEILYTMGDKWDSSNSEYYLDNAHICMQLQNGSLQGFSGGAHAFSSFFSDIIYPGMEKDIEESFLGREDVLKKEYLPNICNMVIEGLNCSFEEDLKR